MPPRKLQVARAKKIAKVATVKGKQWHLAFFTYLESECRLSTNTVAAYRRDLHHFEQWSSGRLPQDLRIRDLSDYVGWLHERKLAPASVARHIVALRMFFNFFHTLPFFGQVYKLEFIFGA